MQVKRSIGLYKHQLGLNQLIQQKTKLRIGKALNKTSVQNKSITRQQQCITINVDNIVNIVVESHNFPTRRRLPPHTILQFT